MAEWLGPLRLVRSYPCENDVFWDPSRAKIEDSALNGFDAIVHLAGENIASGRWSASKKARILASRSQSTKLLCETIAALDEPPSVLVCASAIGFYGDRGQEVLTEDSPPGYGFLPKVCLEWESATAPALLRGIRVAILRIGVVLSSQGGALKKLLPPFTFGLGGTLGSGKQYMSWIAIEDLLGAIDRTLTDNDMKGPINAVAPNPVTNKDFTRALGYVLRKPVFLPIPKFAMHLLYGEMADELFFSSALVQPRKLIASGYTFQYGEIESALRHLLSGPQR